MNNLDEYFMRQALKEAIYAYEKNETPVGAIIVLNKTIIAQAHNMTKELKDISAHAEIQAIGAAELYLNNKNLKECSLYVTLKPCLMCLGAIKWAKLNCLIFGASNMRITKGVFSKEYSLLLKSFFKKKRRFLPHM